MSAIISEIVRVDPDETIEFVALARSNPEKAAILLDLTIKNQVANERESWIVRARMIYFMRGDPEKPETELWRYHPEGFTSFFEYCGQPEVDIAPSVASDMLALCKFAPHLLADGIDIWQVVRTAGHSKVRQIIPQIREAHRNDVLSEEIGPIIGAIDGMSFREVLALTATANVRSSFDLEACYEPTDDGEIIVSFKGLDVDDLEYLTRKVGIKRWYDHKGNRIDPPMNDLPKSLKRGA